MNPAQTFNVQETKLRSHPIRVANAVDGFGCYAGMSTSSRSSHPPYPDLSALIAVVFSPPARALARLDEMTAVNADWKAIGSGPPNERARSLAFEVLQESFCADMEPSLVTASAEGGVGLVYKSPTAYAAIECLNRGRMQMLWFDRNGMPESRRIRNTRKSIREALNEIATLHANA